MNASMTYGGWISESSAVTGPSATSYAQHLRGPVGRMSTTTSVSSNFVRWLGYVAAASAALTGIGTGGEQSIEQLARNAHHLQHMVPTVEVGNIAAVRTPAEDLARIREVLKPAISDLAVTFGVSRQSIYNWLNSEPVANENAAKLQDLAQAADVLAHEGLGVNAALMKRKFSNGRTLMQVAQTGESARDAAQQLVQIHKRETAQRERLAARFANRARTPSTADFDFPATNDHA